MDTESTLAELDRLIADVEDKAFDCGAWEHGSAEDRYDIMLDRLRVAKDELRRFVTTSQNAAVPAGSAVGFLALLAGVVEAERLVVAGLSPEMPCRKMHENRHRAFREALSMATAYFLPNTQGLVTPGTGLSPEKGAASRRHQ